MSTRAKYVTPEKTMCLTNVAHAPQEIGRFCTEVFLFTHRN